MIKSVSKTALHSSDKITGDNVEYWREYLKDVPSHIDLPTDFPRFTSNDHVELPEEYRFSISEDKIYQSDDFFLKHNISLPIFLFSVFNTLIYRYTHQTSFATGYHSNKAFGSNNAFGESNFLLPIKSNFSDEPFFYKIAEQLKKGVDIAHKLVQTPIPTLKTLFSKEDISTSFSEVAFSFIYDIQPEIQDYSLFLVENEERPNQVADLLFFVHHNGTSLQGYVQYNPSLFELRTIGTMMKHFNKLLEALTQTTNQKVEQIALLSKEELNTILYKWNNTSRFFPDKTLHELFQEQVDTTPHAIAVEYYQSANEVNKLPKASLTYFELNKRANQLSNYLRQLGVQPETLVGIYLERSIDMLVAVLGILKAGGAYLPLDPTYPEARINFILKDSEVVFLLSACKLAKKLTTNTEINITCLDRDWQVISKESEENPPININPDNLAYVIYTSGSTGMPKGTMIMHKGVVNYLTWCIRSYQVANGSGCPVSSSISFDATVTSVLSPLLCGRTVLLFPDGDEIDALCTVLTSENNFSLIKITPAHLEILSGLLPENAIEGKTNAVVIGGDALTRKGLTIWQKHASSTRLINEYGPTETVVGCCTYEINSQSLTQENIPIGRPIDNTQIFILDKYLQPVPIGVEGELFIGGAGVARGYLNRPDLTAQRFILNPFSASNKDRLYKTGDKALFLKDGNILFLGRSDFQVKLRGYRIELEEIESVLCECPNVNQAAVLAREDGGDKKLIAYFTLHDKSLYKPKDLKILLSEKLPEYMIPSVFFCLDQLPLTNNGKLDRAALPDSHQERPEMQEDYYAPRKSLEKDLVNFLQKNLNIGQIGIRDNLFELGINSLQAYRMFTKIKSLTGIQLPLAILFQVSTVEQLANYLEKKEARAPWSSLVPIQPNGKKTPIYLVHAGGGTVLFYSKLASYLGTDQPVFGLQPQGLDGKRLFHKNISEMASHYVKEILETNPNGPYLLGGYCFGGVIAFEMAQQLLSKGCKVNLLANFNAVSPTYVQQFNPRPIPREDSQMANRKVVVYPRFSIKNFLRKSISEQFRFIVGKMKSRIIMPIQKKLLVWEIYGSYTYMVLLFFLYKIYRSFGLNPPEAFRKYYFVISNSNMVKSYKPKPYVGDMIIFRSPHIYNDPHIGWSAFVKGKIVTRDIAGHHTTNRQIMNEPFVEQTAKLLKEHIVSIFEDNCINSKFSSAKRT